MISGIYIIYLGEPGKYYVGQSMNVKVRLQQHKSLLKTNFHSNKLLQKAYNTTKEFTAAMVVPCLTSSLNSLEIQLIDLYNSIIKGYNISSGGTTGRGMEHGSTIYNKEDIINAFLLATDVQMTYKQIAKLTSLPETTVRHIAGRETHYWLDEDFPEESAILYNLKSTNARTSCVRKSATYKFKSLISPTGEIYTDISNIAELARKFNLNNAHLGVVLRGTRNSHKGWKGYQND